MGFVSMAIHEIDWIGRAGQTSIHPANIIDGRRVAIGGATLLGKTSPRDGSALYRFGEGSSSDVDAAVEAARSSFEDGRWSRLPGQRRRDVLLSLAMSIDRHREELALLECIDTGKPIAAAAEFDVPVSADTFRRYAEIADKAFGTVYGSTATSLSYELIRPRGVVGAIVGWNFPLLLAAGKIAPILAAGNSLVLKPSELTSASAVRLAELALDAGLPEGVLNVVNGAGHIGAAIAGHADVDFLTFTGSTATGKQILIASGQSNMKGVVLECGGKSPNIVFDDCPDLEAVADAIAARAFWNQGEVCTASSRLLVHESLARPLLELLSSRAASLIPGDPFDPATKFGALVGPDHHRKVISYVEDGKADRLEIAFESIFEKPFPAGSYLGPVIFANVPPTHKIAQEEIFGPVLAVVPFRTDEEAIRIANGTIYGLSAIAWTKDLRRAHQLSQALNVGSLTINATPRPAGGVGHGIMAIGGHKESGLGAEGGTEGMKAYCTKTAVQYFV